MNDTYIALDDKLYELQKVCNRYSETDPLAMWVLYAVDRYITTGRSTRDFDEALAKYPTENLLYLVKKCLNGDRSDQGILKTVALEIWKPYLERLHAKGE